MTYAWTVGAMGKKASAAWSEPVLFRVTPGPTEIEFQKALAVVQSYLAAQEPPAGPVPEVKRDASPEPVSDQALLTDGPMPLLPTTALSVDGGIEATSFTGDGSSLTGVDADTLDGTDGADFTTDTELTSALGSYYTQTELSTSGGGGTVHWSNLSSKPAGLNDGDDDTTCNGVACDGSNFTNVTAVSGDSATGFFTTGQIEEARIATEIARDSEILTVTRCLAKSGQRYLDLGDGTVLDCNTSLIWLRDASCAGLAGTDTDGRGTWITALSAAAALGDGTCGLTDGSSAGDWRVPDILELCSAFQDVGGICPGNAASDSLIDSSVSGSPKVANGKGDAAWSEGDVFAGVEADWYWSAREHGVPVAAWAANLTDGDHSTVPKSVANYVWPVRSGQ